MKYEVIMSYTQIDTADEMVVISKNNEDVSILDTTRPEQSFNKPFVDDITFLFDDIDFSENVFVKDCDGFLNYIAGIKLDIICMYGDDIYNNIVEETVETKGEDGKKKKDKVKVIKNEKPGSFIFFLGKDYCKYWDYRNTDEQNLAEMKVRLAGAISNSNRDVLNNGYMYLDKLVDRLGVNQRDAYRQVAIKYNPDFGNDQISVSNNIKIRDNHITEGGEKVITVEVKGFEPFSIDKWDPIEDFLKIKVNN